MHDIDRTPPAPVDPPSPKRGRFPRETRGDMEDRLRNEAEERMAESMRRSKNG